jgi:hypothetical protein
LIPEILPENVLAAPVERLIVPAEKRRIPTMKSAADT